MAGNDDASEPSTKRRLPVLRLDAPGPRATSELATALGRATDAGHHARVIAIASAISRETIIGCVAPTAAAPLLELIAMASEATPGPVSKSNLRAIERALPSAAEAARTQTLRAIETALEREPVSGMSLIDPHADAAVRRLVALAVTHAVTTVSLVGEGTVSARSIAELPLQAGGALAYRSAALGLARDRSFRERVCDHARWEQEVPTLPGASPGALAVQIFHEYVGAHWREHADAHRLAFEARIVASLN